MSKIIVMAGGTGGHVFPALAVAQELQQQGVDIVWLGTRDRIEAKIIPPTGIPLEWLSVSGLRGNGLKGWLLAPFKLVLSLMQAIRILIKQKPQAVLGMGGFVTGPGGLASWFLRIPLVIHEQNAIAGLTNKTLIRFASKAAEAFPGAFKPHYHALLTGNPVRQEISQLQPPAQRQQQGQQLKLLVLGGSQGALSLNQLIPKVMAALPLADQPEVWHQTGSRHLQITKAGYQQAQFTAKIEAFVDDMALAYQWADLIICRAGALTIAEIAAAGVASILVPYPHAVDDHQTHNAQYLVEAGAALIIQQDQLQIEQLQTLLLNFSAQRSQLVVMAEKARQLARPDAAKQVAGLCLDVMKAG